jgi:hypothetical protein
MTKRRDEIARMKEENTNETMKREHTAKIVAEEQRLAAAEKEEAERLEAARKADEADEDSSGL